MLERRTFKDINMQIILQMGSIHTHNTQSKKTIIILS